MNNALPLKCNSRPPKYKPSSVYPMPSASHKAQEPCAKTLRRKGRRGRNSLDISSGRAPLSPPDQPTLELGASHTDAVKKAWGTFHLPLQSRLEFLERGQVHASLCSSVKASPDDSCFAATTFREANLPPEKLDEATFQHFTSSLHQHWGQLTSSVSSHHGYFTAGNWKCWP